MFQDPLLVPSNTGRGMVPTVRAQELKEALHVALTDIETVIKRRPAFDPRTADRTFTVAASDQLTAVLGVGLITRSQKLAGPGVRVSFRISNPDLIPTQLERGQIDLLIGDHGNAPTDLKSQKLYEEHHVMAQRKGHPRGKKPVDLDAYCGLSHVLVSNSGTGSFHSDIDEQLDKLGRRRNVVLSVHQFVLVPLILRMTDYVALLPSRLLERFSGELDTFDLPFVARGFTVSMAWHQRNHTDCGHIWLRNQIKEVARKMEIARASVAERRLSGRR
jgi:DNA-binding transcriptional LysR family regulator